MLDKSYWQDIVNRLVDKDRSLWAAHVFAENSERLDEILSVVDKEKLIKNCLLSYDIDFSTQPYLNEILKQFTIYDLIDAYKKLEKKSIQTAGALMWLLEDLDPKFTWAIKKMKDHHGWNILPNTWT